MFKENVIINGSRWIGLAEKESPSRSPLETKYHFSVIQCSTTLFKFFRVYPVEVMETQGWKRATTVNLPWVKKMLKFLLHTADMVDDDDQVKEKPSSKKMRMSEERGAM